MRGGYHGEETLENSEGENRAVVSGCFMGERVVREGWVVWLAWDDELAETDRGVWAEVSRDVSA